MRPLQSSTGATAGLEVSEHMKTRVLSAAALLPLLLVIVLVLPAWATAVLFGAAAAIAAYELLYRTGMVKNLRLVIYAMVMAVLVSFWSLRPDSNLAHLGVLAYFALLLGETLLSHGRLRFEKVSLCLAGCRDRNQVRRLILTCSGGPFYGRSRQELQYVTRADALCHPNWRMGAKITIDCATLMNKGLELIEAMRLYRLPMEQVSVVIHRQSVVHSLVEYVDGAVLAQLGTPDMRLPIQLALTWPDRAPCPAPALDLLSCGPLTFDKPDLETFPCLGLAMEAAKAGGTAGAVLSGANEVAVGLYLLDQVGFYDIYDLVKQALDRVPFVEKPNLDQILAADRLAREAVYANLGG